MVTLKFKCELLSNVILNQKAATEGPNQTLDFIPGSCFLGIVADKLYTKDVKDEQGMALAMEIFHSGKVRFGDAHPSNGNLRGLKIPASMYYPKLKKLTDGELYIHHLIPQEILDSEDFKKKQIKQCRNGFYVFENNVATEVRTETDFAIKSAYDKEKRRSKDEQMYGYQSLQKGLVLYFEVEVETENIAAEIKDALVGEKRVGRSRTAQYGLVKIEEENYNDVKTSSIQNNIVTIYADGRLIFLDEFGLPTFRPEAKDLGVENGKIIWEKSQIRTFQYSPWNFRRQCFDADRCGIEKGSVFVVETSNCPKESKYVGSYNNEGFGKVIYNPEFLNGKDDYDKELKKNHAGFAVFEIPKDDKPNTKSKTKAEKDAAIEAEIDSLYKSGIILCEYLGGQKRKEFEEQKIYEMVNNFVHNPQEGGLFTRSGEKFASQWRKIRSISMQEKEYDRLALKLFGKGKDKDGKFINDNMQGYLSHGKALEKWEQKNKVDVVKAFFEGVRNEGLEHRISEAMVNLAAEMAKEMKRK